MPGSNWIITVCIEAPHSCFKDGLNGTHDCRVLAGATLYFALLLGAKNYFLGILVDVSHNIVQTVLWINSVCRKIVHSPQTPPSHNTTGSTLVFWGCDLCR